jgi:hypothetical protein
MPLAAQRPTVPGLLRRGLPLLGGALFAVSLTACAPKTPPVRAPAPMDVAVVALVAPAAGEAVLPAPAALARRVAEQLSARDLRARPLAPESFAAELGARRGSARRLSWLVEQADGAPVVLLIETAAFPYSQIEGRNRWTVTATITIARADRPEDVAVAELTVPVILQFLHEREERAVEEAAVVIERRLARLLDEFLAGYN